MITKTYQLDMHSGGVPVVVHLSQYDSDFSLVFNLYSSSGTFTVESGTTAAIRGTKKDANGQKMTTSQMHFGYPESDHGYFRHFKVIYSKPTDQMKVKTHDDDWNNVNEGCCR